MVGEEHDLNCVLEIIVFHCGVDGRSLRVRMDHLMSLLEWSVGRGRCRLTRHDPLTPTLSRFGVLQVSPFIFSCVPDSLLESLGHFDVM